MAILHNVRSRCFKLYISYFKSCIIFYVDFRSRSRKFAKRYVDTNETQNYNICYQQERVISFIE